MLQGPIPVNHSSIEGHFELLNPESHFSWNLKIGWKLIIPTNGDWRHNFQLIFVISHFELKVFRIFKFLVRIDESEMDGRWRHNPDDDGTFLWCIPESRIDFQPRKSHLRLYKWNWFPTNYPVKLTQIKNFLSVGNDTTQTVIFIVITTNSWWPHINGILWKMESKPSG